MGGWWFEARTRPYAFEREEMTKVIRALGSREVEAASISAWRFEPGRVSHGLDVKIRGGLPEPEMRTVMRHGLLAGEGESCRLVMMGCVMILRDRRNHREADAS
jgi:hypothetical protein